MQRVNVKDARSRLRELLEQVEGGEEVVLLRRGREVARLVPPKGEGHPLPDLSDFRESIAIKGQPLSIEVVRARAEERY
jgi:prevent-host-death family protein